MSHANLDIINRFHEAHHQFKLNELRLLVDDNVRWIAFGESSDSGEKQGFEQVIAFLDKLGTIVRQSDGRVEKLIESADDKHVIECLRVQSKSIAGDVIENLVCILWKIEDSKIIEGRLFFADPEMADNLISYISFYQ